MKNSSPLPINEKERLKALKNYHIMDTLSEEVYDRITELASIICGTSIALISLLDENRQWFKSKVGLKVRETNREISFCQYAILENKIFEVPDANKDPLFSENPLVLGDPKIRFYAGVPLTDNEGYNLGTLCVIDGSPMKLNASQRKALKLLAKEVMAQLVLRKKQFALNSIKLSFENAKDIICLASSDGYFKEVNTRFTEVLGFSKKELLTIPFRYFVHKSDVRFFNENIKKLLKGSPTVEFTCRFITKKGTFKAIAWNAGVEKESGTLYGIGRDVTERENQIKRILVESKIIKTIAKNNGSKYTVAKIAEIICEELGFKLGVFWTVSEDKRKVINPKVYNHIDTLDNSFEVETVKSELRHGEGLPGKVLKTVKSNWVNDIKETQKFPRIKAAIKSNLCSGFCFPIIEGDELTYIGEFYSTDLLFKDEDFLQVFDGIGIIVGTYFQNKRVERKLKDYQFSIDESAMVLIADSSSRITYANELFCSRTEYTPDELIGQSTEIMSSGFFSKEYLDKAWKSISEGNIWKGVIRNKTKTGEHFWADTTIIPFMNEAKKPYQFVSIRYDITDRVLMNERLQKAKEIAEHSMLAKDEFLANISHEIRTPMNAIVGFTELLDETVTSSEQDEYVDSIKVAGRSLLTIINDILDYAKIESDQLILNKEVFNISEAVDQVKKTLISLASKKKVKLLFYTDTDIIQEVLGDEGRLSQVLINLIGNAIKFTEKGKVEVFTTLEKETKTSYTIKFSVKDTGIGIASDKQDKIFDRFKQAEKYTNRKYGGTGLGLSISKRILDAFNSNLQVKSSEGKGSEFFFSLKLSKSTSKHEGLYEDELNEKKSIIGANILLIEDNELNQLLVKKFLAKEDVDVTIASNGKEGIKKFLASKGKIDVILMDLQMPVMNGYDVTKHFRNKIKSKVPIIAMTAHSLVGERKRCLDMGMNEYISKPYTKAELTTKIGKFVSSVKKKKLNSTKKKISTDVFKKVRELGDGDEEFVKEMVSIFLRNGKFDLDQLVKASKESDKKEMALIAHKLKSSFEMFGLNSAYDIVSKLMAPDNYKKQTLISKDVVKLQKICKEIFVQFESYK